MDRERQAKYTFLVVATDGGKYSAKSTSIPVEITLTDVNDNAPRFEEYPFRTRVPSGDLQPGHSILRVRARDADLGPNGEVTYALGEGGKFAGLFRVHPSTGVVSATSSLSQGGLYRLEVIARDKGEPALGASGLVEIRVGESSLERPALKFQNESYDVVVQENSPPGTDIAQLTAVRSDGRRQHILYSIGSGNDLRSFAVDEESGLVRVNEPGRLDAELWGNGDEQDAWQTLVLVARTSGPDFLEAYAKLRVRLSDVNDNPPVFTQSQYSATVLEGNAKGDFVVKVG